MDAVADGGVDAEASAGSLTTPQVRRVASDGWLSHNPATTADFRPISSALGLVDIAATTERGRVSGVSLVVTVTHDEKETTLTVPMARLASATGERFTARVKTGMPRAQYRFIGHSTSGDESSGEFAALISPTLVLPDWAMGATWYQVFPERFRNGNPTNDPRTPGTTLAKWNCNWYEVQPGEAEAYRTRHRLLPDAPLPERNGGPLYHVIYERRYGGDLQGLAEKLDELKDLGITAIYLNPIFEAHSLHKYDASDHRHIDEGLARPAEAGPQPAAWHPDPTETLDPATWKWTAADRYFVDVFLPACRQRGLRVVLDGVWNHTGKEHFAFRHVMEKGKDSPYADWFYFEFGEDGKPTAWKAWDRPNGSLPKFRQVDAAGNTAEKGDLAPSIKSHIFAVTKRWMDPNGDGDPSDGIDGWRLDVATDIGARFWKDWRTHVKSINPDAAIIAEIWDPAYDQLTGDAFDTQMHYPFAFAVLDWLSEGTAQRPAVSSDELAERLAKSLANPPQTNLLFQNLFASHDTERFVNMLWNPGRGYDRGAEVQNGAVEKDGYQWGRPPEDTYTRSLLGVAIQAMYLGSPMVYYGDEYGMWGADDPTCRKPLPWPDTGPNDNPDDVAMPRIRDEYARWMRLRQDPEIGDVLRYGSVQHLEAGNPDVFAFERTLNGKRVIVIVNRGAAEYDAGELTGGNSLVPTMSALVWR